MSDKPLENIYVGLGTSATYPQELIEYGIKKGFRFIDTAFMYKSEECVGSAIKNSIENGIVKRSDLFIQSKVPHIRAGYRCTLEAFDECLNKLGVDYLDSYLIHYPMRNCENWKDLTIDTWMALEKLHKEGKIKYIGVSNFLQHHLEFLLSKAEIKPMINQLELHPFRHQKSLCEFCKKNDMVLQAWFPLGKTRVFYSDFLKEIARKYHTSIAKFVIQWHKQQGFIPVIGMYSEDEINAAIDERTFEISMQDMQKIEELDGTWISGMHTEDSFLNSLPVFPVFPRIQNALKDVACIKQTLLFGFIPFFKIKIENENHTKFYLFNILLFKQTRKICKLKDKTWSKNDFKSNGYTIECIFNIKNEFLECPVWDEKEQSIYCVASRDNKIYKIHPKTKEFDVIPTLEGIVGSIALDGKGGLIVAEESGIYKINIEKNERLFLINPKDKDKYYNDGKMDAKGRFIVGTNGHFNDGKLYSYDGKTVKVLEENITCSNGIAFSTDNKTMYYIDSGCRKVAKYNYDLETGNALFDSYVIEFKNSIPDGMCIDKDDNLWIAEYDGCCVSKWSTKTYEETDKIKFPVYVTSCCLGGGRLKDEEYLYVTTCKKPNGGKNTGLYRVKLK